MNKKEILVFSGALVLVLVFLFGVVFVFSWQRDEKNIVVKKEEPVIIIDDDVNTGIPKKNNKPVIEEEEQDGEDWPEKNPLNGKEDVFNFNIKTWSEYFNYQNKIKMIYPFESLIDAGKGVKKTNTGCQIDFNFGLFSIISLDSLKKIDTEDVDYLQNKWINEYNIYFDKKKVDNCKKNGQILTCNSGIEESIQNNIIFHNDVKYSFATKLSNDEQKNSDIVEIVKLIMNNIEFDYKWKKYVNKDVGFEFEYPEYWQIDKDRSKEDKVVFDIIVTSIESVKYEIGVNLNYEEMMKQKVSQYESITDNVKETFIGLNKALRIETRDLTGIKIFIVNNDKYIELTTGGRMESQGILDSFKIY